MQWVPSPSLKPLCRVTVCVVQWVPYLTELFQTRLLFHGDKAPNRHNNVFLPEYSDRKAMLASKDANYMGAS